MARGLPVREALKLSEKPHFSISLRGEISFLGIIGGKKNLISQYHWEQNFSIAQYYWGEKNLISQYYWNPLDFTRAPCPNGFPLSSISHMLHFLPCGHCFPDSSRLWQDPFEVCTNTNQSVRMSPACSAKAPLLLPGTCRPEQSRGWCFHSEEPVGFQPRAGEGLLISQEPCLTQLGSC